MANFHPSENELLEYSAGNLDWALSIVVSAHMQMCPQCKQKCIQLNALGASIMNNTKPVAVETSSFDNVMAKIKQQTALGSTPEKPEQNINANKGASRTQHLPDVVSKLLPDNEKLHWKFVSPALREAQLVTGQDKYEVSFHKIKRGGKVAEHDHGGLEVTLVLEGSFSDANGNYVAGDYIVKQPGEVHRPIAAQDQDCLCFTVVEAPVKVTGIIGKIVNPFLSISPR
ncbi:MAG: ChrR family anti-sigma-E factor [Agarilytica sp.]